MKKIIYYVATSVDGFISGPNEDISGFKAAGNGLAQYLADLKDLEPLSWDAKPMSLGINMG